jgi:hypothetical protein
MEETAVVVGALVSVGYVDYTRSRKRVHGFVGEAPPRRRASVRVVGGRQGRVHRDHPGEANHPPLIIEAARDADELILLREGRVAARGRPAAILADVTLVCAERRAPSRRVPRLRRARLPDPPCDVDERRRACGRRAACPRHPRRCPKRRRPDRR